MLEIFIINNNKTFLVKISLTFLLIFISCISSKKISNGKTIADKTFIFESAVRTINIVFDTTDCQITIIYKCSSISNEHRQLNINCTYKQLNDSILVIKNKLYDTKAEPIDLTPPKEELEKCLPTNLTVHKNKNKVNAWANDDGFIPPISIDTIKVFSKNKRQFLFLSKRRGLTVYNFLMKEK